MGEIEQVYQGERVHRLKFRHPRWINQMELVIESDEDGTSIDIAIELENKEVDHRSIYLTTDQAMELTRVLLEHHMKLRV